jgi:hypothetical protein
VTAFIGGLVVGTPRHAKVRGVEVSKADLTDEAGVLARAWRCGYGYSSAACARGAGATRSAGKQHGRVRCREAKGYIIISKHRSFGSGIRVFSTCSAFVLFVVLLLLLVLVLIRWRLFFPLCQWRSLCFFFEQQYTQTWCLILRKILYHYEGGCCHRER